MSDGNKKNDLLVFSEKYVVDQDYFLETLDQQIDLTRLLSIALRTAGLHDQMVNKHLKKPLLNENESWVITQSSIDLMRWPRLNEQLIVTTRVIEVNRFFVKRFFEIKIDRELLLTIVSQYAIINLESRKMARVSVSSLEAIQAIDDSIAYEFNKLRVPETYHSTERTGREIVAKDIDYNQHVNNEVYIRWSYEMLPQSYFADYNARKIEVKYGSELRFDEEAEVVAYLPDESIINEGLGEGSTLQTYQTIRNKTKQKDACYVRITWELK